MHVTASLHLLLLVVLLDPAAAETKEKTGKKILVKLSDEDCPEEISQCCLSLANRNGGAVDQVYEFGGYRGCSLSLAQSPYKCDEGMHGPAPSGPGRGLCLRGVGNAGAAAAAAAAAARGDIVAGEDLPVYADEHVPLLRGGVGVERELNLFLDGGEPPWNLDRIDQCHPPLDGATYVRGDAGGAIVFVVDTGVRMDHQMFAGGMIDPADSCHKSLVDTNVTTDPNGHG